MSAIWSIPDIAFPLRLSTFCVQKNSPGSQEPLAPRVNLARRYPTGNTAFFFSFSFFLARRIYARKSASKILPLHDNKHFLVSHLKRTNKQKTNKNTAERVCIHPLRSRRSGEEEGEKKRKRKEKTTTDYITAEVAWPGSNKELILTSAVCGACQSRAAAI